MEETNQVKQVDYSLNLTSSDIEKMSDEQFVELIAKTESDPLLKAVVLRALADKPLLQFKRINDRRNQPYYNEKTAREVQRAIDYMMKEKKSIEFPSSLRPSLKLSSFRNVLSQGLIYLIDNLDPDKRYKNFRREFEINTDEAHKCIAFSLIDKDMNLSFREVKTSSSFDDVKVWIEKFIKETVPGQKIEMPNEAVMPFDLTEEQVFDLKEVCDKAGSVRSIITKVRVVLFKEATE